MANEFKNRKVKVNKRFREITAREGSITSREAHLIARKDSRLISDELAQMEEYFANKIQIYLNDFEDERLRLNYFEREKLAKLEFSENLTKSKNLENSEIISRLENELEESRESQIELLLKLRNSSNRIKELEIKMELYKSKLRKQQ
jgi:hypothetical protein